MRRYIYRDGIRKEGRMRRKEEGKLNKFNMLYASVRCSLRKERKEERKYERKKERKEKDKKKEKQTNRSNAIYLVRTLLQHWKLKIFIAGP